MIQPPRILFFVNDCVPSDEQMLEAQGYGNRVSFRNATFVPDPVLKNGNLLNANFIEKCDGVAGEVPDLYKDHPSAETIMEEYDAQRKKLLAEAKKGAKKPAAKKKVVAKKTVEPEPTPEWTPNA